MVSRVHPVVVLALAGCAQTVFLDDTEPAVDTAVGEDTAVDTGEDTAPDDTAPDDTAPDDTAEVEPCSSPDTVSLAVSFPARAPGCPWRADGNGDPREGYLTARAEDTVSLELGPAARVCGVTLAFDASDSVLAYDDAFLLTFGDVVLAASHSALVGPLATDGPLRLYDWAVLLGVPINLDDADGWCLGADVGLATCVVPRPEAPGPLTLELNEALLAEVAERAFGADRFEVGLVTFGDNDVATDCSHADFGLTVEVTFDPS